LIVVVQFKHQYVFIRFVGTHAEYDKLKDASQV
jgi:mRNA-degrading endonuclease HigB of HigAB toxin-antitoxin module